MIVDDRVYGEVDISEPVLLELMETDAMQRLKGVNQAGASKLILNKPISRYEHCVGTMILLKKLGVGVEEQIAGLLHDVAHTAFSHVVDFAFPNQDHDFHERFHEKIVHNSKIPQILKQYGFDIDRLLDDTNYPILERNLPDLCADRLDYTFRDMAGYLDSKEAMEHIERHLKSLRVKDGKIVLANFRDAAQLTMDFITLNRWVWARPLEVASFHLLGKAMRRAKELGILTMDDFFLDDDAVYGKLENSGDSKILETLSVLRDGFSVRIDDRSPDLVCKTKARYIDPEFITADGLKRVSDHSDALKKAIAKHRKFVEEGYNLRLISSSVPSSSE